MSRAREFADLAGSADAGGLTGRNMIINGAMQVWQRGTSNSSASANTYPAADRWKFWVNGSTMGTTRTAFTVGQTDVPNIQYYNSISIASNSGTGHYHTIAHHIEDITRFDNVNVTLSFYAKASVAWTMGIEPIQNFGSGGSPSTRVLGTTQTVSVGTSWSRHEVTFTLPSISGKTLGTTANTSNFELSMWLSAGSDFDSRSGSIGNQSGTFDITGVQLEVGDTATPFEHRSYRDELERGMRYFYRLNDISEFGAIGTAIGTNSAWYVPYSLPVYMRASPSLSVSSVSHLRTTLQHSNSTDATSISIGYGGPKELVLSVQAESNSAGTLRMFGFKNTSGYLDFSAEL